MTRTLMIAASIGLAVATTGCSSMLQGNGGDGESVHMGGRATVDIDPAGSATIGTGSTSFSGADTRVDFAAGIGLD